MRDAAEHAGAKEVHLLYEPMAAAIGIGIDVDAAAGNMIIDIGGGTTEIAIISLAGIVNQESIKTISSVRLFLGKNMFKRRNHNSS